MSEMMRTLEKAEEMLSKGIEEINQKGELNASSLELLGNAVDALKDICEIKEKMQGGDYERYMPMYYGDYERGRRRDSRGRYMDDGRGYERYDMDYRDYGAHEDKDYLKWKMQNASNDQERERYRRQLEQM